MTSPHETEERIDHAVAGRLSRLAALPVDTSALDRALRAELPPRARTPRRWWAPLTAAAALLILTVMLSLGLFQGREAQASALLMAQMHQDIVTGKVPTMQADSIDQANHAIAAFAGGFPKLPQPPATHTMACCMRNIDDKKVACVLLNDGGIPVTMAIANASEVQSPKSAIVVRSGVTYHVDTVGNLNMVMMERAQRWVCLIGQLPKDKLMDLADEIRF